MNIVRKIISCRPWFKAALPGAGGADFFLFLHSQQHCILLHTGDDGGPVWEEICLSHEDSRRGRGYPAPSPAQGDRLGWQWVASAGDSDLSPWAEGITQRQPPPSSGGSAGPLHAAAQRRKPSTSQAFSWSIALERFLK